MSTPDEAYKEALAARAKRAQEENDAQKYAEAYPALAEQKLEELNAALKAKVPDGLSLETQFGPGGTIGRRGVKGLFLKLIEDGNVVAQGAISCSNDEKIVLTGFPPDGDKRPKQEFGESPFATFSTEMAVKFMTDLIRTYI